MDGIEGPRAAREGDPRLWSERTWRYKGFNDGLVGVKARFPTKTPYMEGYQHACSILANAFRSRRGRK